MKKFFAAAVIVGLSAVYIFTRVSGTPSTEPAPTATGDTTPTPANTTPTPVATAPKTGYKDGVYTGSNIETVYGPVQIKATIKGGLISDVAFIQYPNKGGHTAEVSNYSMPVLIKEAITIQGANVDTISGATQTVQGFQQSLGNALSQAKA